MQKATRRQPQAWQRDPQNIRESRIQYWVQGVMVTAQMSLEAARTRVADGKAFIISSQAIGLLTDGYANS